MSEKRERLDAVLAEQLELLTYLREHYSLPAEEMNRCLQVLDRLEEIAATLEREVASWT